jgi:hypothetical protein
VGTGVLADLWRFLAFREGQAGALPHVSPLFQNYSGLASNSKDPSNFAANRAVGPFTLPKPTLWT